MRLFVGIIPPPLVLDHLSRALAAVMDARVARSPWLPRSCWHLTLTFFGEVPTGSVPSIEEATRAAARGFAPVTIRLMGAGTFRERVAWIGTGGEPLVPLMKAMTVIRDDLTTTRDDRQRNRAHLTIARAARDDHVQDMVRSLSVYRGPSWTVDRIHLINSDLGMGDHGHPLYDVVATMPLGHLLPAELRDESGSDPDVSVASPPP